MTTIESVTAEIMNDRELINVIVRVTDSDGASGVGEAWWGIPAGPGRQNGATARPIASVVDDLLAPRVVGLDPGPIERIWFDLWDWGYRYGDEGILMMGMSGLDLALWDLKAKRAGVGVAELLGGPVADRVPAYASFPALRDDDRLVAETERALAYGFDAIKLHELDPAKTEMLRDRFGPDLKIMVDVNGHFDPIEAIDHGRRLQAAGVLWFEEPVRPMRDHRAIARVGAALDCDLAGGENEYTVDDFLRLLATGALTYLQPEITKIGGLTAARRVSALAEQHNVALCPHNFRLGPALFASLHWGFTSTAIRWFELPWVPSGVAFSYPVELPPVIDGMVELPSGPGWGC